MQERLIFVKISTASRSAPQSNPLRLGPVIGMIELTADDVNVEAIQADRRSGALPDGIRVSANGVAPSDSARVGASRLEKIM
jgi:hypothetical protein